MGAAGELKVVEGSSTSVDELKPAKHGHPNELPADCCTYDQVYSRIIEMLNQTIGPAGDPALSLAYLDELQVSRALETSGPLEALCSDLNLQTVPSVEREASSS